MKRHVSAVAMIAASLLVLVGFQNCSDVSFDQGSSAGSNQNANGGPGGGSGGPDSPVDGSIGQNGGTTGGPVVTGGPGGTTNPVVVPAGFPPPPPGSTDAPPIPPPGATFPPGTPTVPAGYPLPRVVQVEPPCERLQWCAYELQLDKEYPMVVDFDWRTNDDLNIAVPIPAGKVRAVPNVHYVPGSGHVTFLPSETKRIVYVLNINPDPVISIAIPFRFSRCMYGRVGVKCSDIFR